ncbi:MAG: hypothetical protein U0353_29750 [Sandaracinus sp.]
MSPLELAPYARASLRRDRMVQLALAAILGGLGALVIAILLGVTISGAAGPDDGVPIIAGITFAVTVLPALWLLKLGLPNESRHVLVRMLEQHPEKVRHVSFSYVHQSGSPTRLASVESAEGTWSFAVPPEETLARAPRRLARSGREMTSFRGEFLPLEHAWSGLEGPGSVEVSDEALVLAGVRRRTRLATLFGVCVGTLGGALAILFFVEVDLSIDDPRLPAVVAIVLAVAGYAGTKSLLSWALPRAVVRVALPWTYVQDVRLAGVDVDVQSLHPELTGLSRFRTDRGEVLVSRCRGS